MSLDENIDFVNQWYNTIAEQWVRDFVIRGFMYEEVNVEVTDPEGDAESGVNIDIKNVICTIKVRDTRVYLWVFFNFKKNEFVDVDSLDNQDLDPIEIAQEIYAINERWKKNKIIQYLKQ